jgi:hypothetical protein
MRTFLTSLLCLFLAGSVCAATTTKVNSYQVAVPTNAVVGSAGGTLTTVLNEVFDWLVVLDGKTWTQEQLEDAIADQLTAQVVPLVSGAMGAYTDPFRTNGPALNFGATTYLNAAMLTGRTSVSGGVVIASADLTSLSGDVSVYDDVLAGDDVVAGGDLRAAGMAKITGKVYAAGGANVTGDLQVVNGSMTSSLIRNSTITNSVVAGTFFYKNAAGGLMPLDPSAFLWRPVLAFSGTTLPSDPLYANYSQAEFTSFVTNGAYVVAASIKATNSSITNFSLRAGLYIAELSAYHSALPDHTSSTTKSLLYWGITASLIGRTSATDRDLLSIYFKLVEDGDNCVGDGGATGGVRIQSVESRRSPVPFLVSSVTERFRLKTVSTENVSGTVGAHGGYSLAIYAIPTNITQLVYQ